MTTAPTIHYATPPAPVKPHSRIGVVAFALSAFAAGGMLLSVLAVSFPLMNAPPSWETPAMVFAITMVVAWVLSFVMTFVALLLRNTSRTFPRWAFGMSLLALMLAVFFIAVA